MVDMNEVELELFIRRIFKKTVYETVNSLPPMLIVGDTPSVGGNPEGLDFLADNINLTVTSQDDCEFQEFASGG